MEGFFNRLGYSANFALTEFPESGVPGAKGVGYLRHTGGKHREHIVSLEENKAVMVRIQKECFGRGNMLTVEKMSRRGGETRRRMSYGH